MSSLVAFLLSLCVFGLYFRDFSYGGWCQLSLLSLFAAVISGLAIYFFDLHSRRRMLKPLYHYLHSRWWIFARMALDTKAFGTQPKEVEEIENGFAILRELVGEKRRTAPPEGSGIPKEWSEQ